MIHDHDTSLLSPLSASAAFSDCRRYRYTLERVWDPTKPPICFLMLNPSIADAFRVDRTVKKCMKFAWREGCGGLRVVNLFALRSTDPKAMLKSESPVESPADQTQLANDWWIADQTVGVRVVAGWGCHGKHLGRDLSVLNLLGECSIECFATTKDGPPAASIVHPG